MDTLDLSDVHSISIESAKSHYSCFNQDKDIWRVNSGRVRLTLAGKKLQIFLSATEPVSKVILSWIWNPPEGCRILSDHWERSYGDLGWFPMDPERVMPWYFALASSDGHTCMGVSTGARAMCHWQVEANCISLHCDVRAGRDPVELGDRELEVAEIVHMTGATDESLFQTLRRFCSQLCEAPIRMRKPVYGFNDWYYAYGKSTQKTIQRDAQLLGKLTQGLDNRPHCVIDSGYQLGRAGASGGPFHLTNSFFPDMKELALDIREADVLPGLWVRVLRTQERLPENWIRQAPVDRCGDLIDPSIPEAVDYVMNGLKPLLGNWGYGLIKHDFSTYDIFGRWGFEMGKVQFAPEYASFRNKDRTTAEVILDLYRAIRKTCGTSIIIGCNTVGHLAAGLVEIQRIGDDTSGQDWSRTRRMGINTLAFRGVQHDTFFAADADCVGLTKSIPWELNRQWLDLLARSGTPLFVSADPDALGVEQWDGLTAAFLKSSRRQPLGEPIDWMDSVVPSKWLLQGQLTRYNWSGTERAEQVAMAY